MDNARIMWPKMFASKPCLLLLSRIPSPGANTSTLINTTGNVNHIEPDLYIQDNLLFADGDELKTTNGLTIQSLGLSANLMSGFIQLSDSLVVAVDFYNHCLRSLNRVTQQTSVYSGVCMEPDWVDGEEPKFRQPSSVIRDVMSTAVLIITEHGNEALRTINMNNMTGGTLIRSSLLSNPHGLTQHPTSGDLYISVHHSIVTYHYSQKVLTILTGSGHPSFQDGRFSEAAFYYPAAVLLLLEANQLIVSDNTNYRLRILDLDTSTTSSICSGVYGQVDGNLRTCQLLEVAAVTVIDGVLYIGESKSIRFIGRGNYIPFRIYHAIYCCT